MNKANIPIVIGEGAKIPKYQHIGDAGFDLVAAQDVIIEPGETKVVPTKLSVQLPEGTFFMVVPRSGVSLKTRLRVANSPGIVDSNFRGEIGVIVDNIAQPEYQITSHGELKIEYDYKLKLLNGVSFAYVNDQYPIGTYIIMKGQRIAQGIIMPYIHAEFVQVEKLDETERGNGAFGSTGI